MQINWELVWRALRVGLLAIMAYLTQELSPMVVQGDDPVTFGPGALAGLMALLSAAEAVYALLKRFGVIKTNDVPAVKAVTSALVPYGNRPHMQGDLPQVYTPEWTKRDEDDLVSLLESYEKRPLSDAGYHRLRQLKAKALAASTAMPGQAFSGPLHDPVKDGRTESLNALAEDVNDQLRAIDDPFVPPKQGAD